MKKKVWSLFFMSSALMVFNSAMANSLWSFTNKTGHEVDLVCIGDSMRIMFDSDKVNPGEAFSYQFSTGMGDGTGVPAMNVYCRIRTKDNASKIKDVYNVNFNIDRAGYDISIILKAPLDEQSMEIKMKDYYQSKIVKPFLYKY